MREISWHRLAEPFEADAVRWHAASVDVDAARVRLAPHLAASALRARLDAVAGPDGWSLRLRPWNGRGLIAELTIGAAVRSSALAALPNGTYRAAPSGDAVANDASDDLVELAEDAATEVAFAAAATGFGAVPPVVAHGGGWVEAAPADSADGTDLRPLHAPAARAVGDADASPTEPPPRSEAGAEPTSAGTSAGTNEGSNDGRDEGQRVIDRLIERLREEGLGAEAAKRVTAHGGYGSTTEARRGLYAELRALLKERSAVG